MQKITKRNIFYIKGIDKCFEYFLDNINKADKGVFENLRVDKIKKYINILEKAQQLNYLNDTTNIKIYDINLPFSNILLEKLGDLEIIMLMMMNGSLIKKCLIDL